MKTIIRIGLLAVMAVGTSVLFSCAPPPVSIEKRISDFVSSLNGDRTDTYTNFDPSSPGSLASKTYWDTLFTASTPPFSYTPNPPNTSNSSAVDITVTGASGPSYSFRFVMANIGTISANWVIEHPQLPPGTTIL